MTPLRTPTSRKSKTRQWEGGVIQQREKLEDQQGKKREDQQGEKLGKKREDQQGERVEKILDEGLKDLDNEIDTDTSEDNTESWSHGEMSGFNVHETHKEEEDGIKINNSRWLSWIFTLFKR